MCKKNISDTYLILLILEYLNDINISTCLIAKI